MTTIAQSEDSEDQVPQESGQGVPFSDPFRNPYGHCKRKHFSEDIRKVEIKPLDYY